MGTSQLGVTKPAVLACELPAIPEESRSEVLKERLCCLPGGEGAAEDAGPMTFFIGVPPFPRKLDIILMGKWSTYLRAAPKAMHIRRAANILVLAAVRTRVLGVKASYPASRE